MTYDQAIKEALNRPEYKLGSEWVEHIREGYNGNKDFDTIVTASQEYIKLIEEVYEVHKEHDD